MVQTKNEFLHLFLLQIVLIFIYYGNCLAGVKEDIFRLVDNGSVLVEHNGRQVIALNEDEDFIPASTIKLLTSLLAVKELGLHYRFNTLFYLDEQANLLIKGYGDPFLVSEEIGVIIQTLKEKGVFRVNNIYLDDHSFALERDTPGSSASLNPYDAKSGGLVVNFNSLPLRIVEDDSVVPDEPQTPLLPIMQKAAVHLPEGSHRVNIDGLPLFPSPFSSNSLQYAGELFMVLFQTTGITVSGKLSEKPPQYKGQVIYNHISTKSLSDILRACLKYSNNFMANQLYLTAGALHSGYPATWEKAKLALDTFWQEIDKSQEIAVFDGSGLSTENRMTARQIIKVLDLLRPYAESLLPQKAGALVKSGTMKNVHCYAGFVPHDGVLSPFVVLLNQQENNREEILSLIVQMIKQE